MYKKYQNQSGFTLIEILVSSAILVLLGSGFLGLQYIISQNQTTAWSNYQSIEDANTVVAGVSKELRNASQSEIGAYFLETAGDQELIFYSDYDLDGVVERIRYTLNGSSLVKGVVEPTGDPAVYDLGTEKQRNITEIARNGINPVFYYYNSNWPTDTLNNPLAEVDRIAETTYIGIILITNPNPNLAEFDYTIESNVKLRSH